MDTNQEHVGYVTRYFKDRSFGFIENEAGEVYFFFRDKVELMQQKQAGLISFIHSFNEGDRVSFKLRESVKQEGKLEAYDVVYLTNKHVELLTSEFENNSVLEGKLKIVDEAKFFVHHSDTGMDLPVSISAWEENLEEVYHARENTLVSFKITKVGKKHKFSVALTDIQLIPAYYEIMSHYSNQTTLPGKVTGINKFGVHVAICQGKVKGFIYFSPNMELEEVNDKLRQLQKGVEIEVWVKYPIRHNTLQVALALHKVNA